MAFASANESGSSSTTAARPASESETDCIRPKRLGSGEEKGTGAIPLPIHRRFQVPEQAGRVLHLVDDHRWRVARQERPRVALRLLGLAREVERHEAVLREQPAHQARLPGLAGAGEHDDRPRRRPLAQERLDLPIHPHHAYSTIWSNDLHVLARRPPLRLIGTAPRVVHGSRGRPIP